MHENRVKKKLRPISSRTPAVLLVVGLAWMASACSSGAATSSVASLPGHAGTSHSSGPLAQAQGDQDLIDFARCMRAHGVQMSDPFHRSGHAGLTMEIPTVNAATQSAFTACNHFVQPIVAAKQAGAQQELASWLPELANYAQCMRSHDIAMLDPNAQGALNLGDVPGITDDFGRYTPQFRSADSACKHLLPAGVHDDGTGP